MYQLVFGSHEELVAFVKLLSQLPIPEIEGVKSVTFRYYPNTAQIRIEYVIEQTHFYRFTYFLDQNDASENLGTLSEQKQMLDKEIVLSKDENINALTQFKIRWEDSEIYRCWIDMDSWLVMFEVRNDNTDLSTKSIIDVFAPMKIEESLRFPNSAVK